MSAPVSHFVLARNVFCVIIASLVIVDIGTCIGREHDDAMRGHRLYCHAALRAASTARDTVTALDRQVGYSSCATVIANEPTTTEVTP